MWDWDGFFIGCHLASIGKPEYLKYWVLNFAEAIDQDGYVPGCVTPAGPRPIFGKFAMKPFLAQGAFLSAKAMNDFTWLEPVFDRIKRVCQYREQTQFDPKYGLFFWDNAMQSGADNSVVLSNDDREPSAILGVDINVFQYREYLAALFPALPASWAAKWTTRPTFKTKRATQGEHSPVSTTVGQGGGFPPGTSVAGTAGRYGA